MEFQMEVMNLVTDTSVATTAKSLAKDTSKTEQKKILTTAEFTSREAAYGLGEWCLRRSKQATLRSARSLLRFLNER
jgi:hypothetical protein